MILTHPHKKYTSCGNRRYKTKTNLHEKKTAYVRKILIDFMYKPEVVFFLTPKIHCHSREIRLLNKVQILDDQLANCDHEFSYVKRRAN